MRRWCSSVAVHDASRPRFALRQVCVAGCSPAALQERDWAFWTLTPALGFAMTLDYFCNLR